jgi:hypothetical protein
MKEFYDQKKYNVGGKGDGSRIGWGRGRQEKDESWQDE